MPKEVMPVTGFLKGLEGDVLREGLKYRSLGSSDSLLAYRTWRDDLEADHGTKEPEWKFPEGVACIPGKGGPCQPILIVFMGEHDNRDVLLLEALEYLAARCRRVTKYVIFQAASWSAFPWVAHREAFSLSGAIPILKLVGSEPQGTLAQRPRGDGCDLGHDALEVPVEKERSHRCLRP